MTPLTYRISDATRDALAQAAVPYKDYMRDALHQNGSERTVQKIAPPTQETIESMREAFRAALTSDPQGEAIIQSLEQHRSQAGAPVILLENLTTRDSAYSVLEMYRQFMTEGMETSVPQRAHETIKDELDVNPQAHQIKTAGVKRIHFDPDDFSALTCIEEGNNPRPTLFYDVDARIESMLDALQEEFGEAKPIDRSAAKHVLVTAMLEPHWLPSNEYTKDRRAEPLIMANPAYDPDTPQSTPYVFCKKNAFCKPLELAEDFAIEGAEPATHQAKMVTRLWDAASKFRSTNHAAEIQLHNGDMVTYSNHATMHGGGDLQHKDQSYLHDLDLHDMFRTRHLASVDIDICGKMREQAKPDLRIGKEHLHHLGVVAESARTSAVA